MELPPNDLNPHRDNELKRGRAAQIEYGETKVARREQSAAVPSLGEQAWMTLRHWRMGWAADRRKDKQTTRDILSNNRPDSIMVGTGLYDTDRYFYIANNAIRLEHTLGRYDIIDVTTMAEIPAPGLRLYPFQQYSSYMSSDRRNNLFNQGFGPPQ